MAVLQNPDLKVIDLSLVREDVKRIADVVFQRVIKPFVEEITIKSEATGTAEYPIVSELLPLLELFRKKYPRVSFDLVLNGKYDPELPLSGVYIIPTPVTVENNAITSDYNGINTYGNSTGRYVFLSFSATNTPTHVEFGLNNSGTDKYDSISGFLSQPIILVSKNKDLRVITELTGAIDRIKRTKVNRLKSLLTEVKVKITDIKSVLMSAIGKLIGDDFSLISEVNKVLLEGSEFRGRALVDYIKSRLIRENLTKLGFEYHDNFIPEDNEIVVYNGTGTSLSVMYFQQLNRLDPKILDAQTYKGSSRIFLINRYSIKTPQDRVEYGHVFSKFSPRNLDGWRIPKGFDISTLDETLLGLSKQIELAVIEEIKSELIKNLSEVRTRKKRVTKKA